MSTRVSVRHADTGGGVVAVKSATTPDEIAALAREAARLDRASHPGVVALVDHRIGEGEAELHTRFAGEGLDRWRGTLPRLAGLGAAVAATLADLHQIGIVHGRIEASHVLVGDDGRPRLCGFSSAADAEPAVDIAALGRLLADLLAQTQPAARHGTIIWRRGPLAERRAFEQVLDHACDEVASRRPSAQAFAAALLAAVPGAELPPSGDAAPPAPHPPTPTAVARAKAADANAKPAPKGVTLTAHASAEPDGENPTDAAVADNPWSETDDEDTALAPDPQVKADAPAARYAWPEGDGEETPHHADTKAGGLTVPGNARGEGAPLAAYGQVKEDAPAARYAGGDGEETAGHADVKAKADPEGLAVSGNARGEGAALDADGQGTADATAAGHAWAEGDGQGMADSDAQADPGEPTVEAGVDDESDEDDPTTPGWLPFDDVFGDQTDVGLDDVFADRPWSGRRLGERRRHHDLGPEPSRRRVDRLGAEARRRRPGRLVALALVTAATVAGVLLWTGHRPRPDRSPEAAPQQASPPGDSAASCPTSPAGPPPTIGAGVTVDVDGDGCPDDVRIQAGVVYAAGDRWAIGGPDDQVAVGDWDCDGRATPALYRPATGDVFVFPTWAAPGEPLTVEAVDQVAGGQALAVEPGAAGDCDVPLVELATGEHHPIDLSSTDRSGAIPQ